MSSAELTGAPRLRFAGAACAGGWLISFVLLLGSCSTPQHAELIVVVTTDLSLPTDLDWLDLSVTGPSHEVQPQGLQLTANDSLPGTFAIVAANEDADPISIHVQGRLGGKAGAVRVQRDALVRMPISGTKMLKMELSWLCSDVNLPNGCDPGSTCGAGRCEDATVTGPLADFVAPKQPVDCFDTVHCTFSTDNWSLVVPTFSQITNDCIVDAHEVPPDPVSVALMVNQELAGNAGVCVGDSDGPASEEDPAPGNCFIPLNQDDSESGWQRVQDAGADSEFRLPRAVCDAVGRGTVTHVALTHNGCAAKTSAEPLCPAASLCVRSASSCPDDLPDTWFGYSCSGSATPSASDPTLKYCGTSDTDPDSGPTVRGHECCTTGQSSDSTNPLLIDDMSQGPLIKLAPKPDQFPGNWFTASEDSSSPLSPPQGSKLFFTYRRIDPVTPKGGPTFDRAACFTMKQGFSGHYALEGFFFATQGATVPLDVSPYAGISFWAMITGLGAAPPPPMSVHFPDSNTDTEHGSPCLEEGIVLGTGKDNCNSYNQQLTSLNDKWQKFSVSWDGLQQDLDFGMRFDHFEKTQVYSVDFQAKGQGAPTVTPAFDFCVSQIYFEPRASQ